MTRANGKTNGHPEGWQFWGNRQRAAHLGFPSDPLLWGPAEWQAIEGYLTPSPTAFQLALEADPDFQAAIAERDAAQARFDEASRVYLEAIQRRSEEQLREAQDRGRGRGPLPYYGNAVLVGRGGVQSPEIDEASDLRDLAHAAVVRANTRAGQAGAAVAARLAPQAEQPARRSPALRRW